jgi:hypothetical protein
MVNGEVATSSKRSMRVERDFEPTRLAREAMTASYAALVPIKARRIAVRREASLALGSDAMDHGARSSTAGEHR